MEYAENIVQLLANLISLLLCLFHYISNKRRGWFLAIAFFLCSLLSCYFWNAHLIIMGTSPEGLDWLTYSGWNAAYLVLFILLMGMKSPEERAFFHPLMLVPIPLNALQFMLYLPYGSLLNNLYQVLIGTLLAVFSLQGIIWYCKRWQQGARRPFGCLAVLIFISLEFGMWTTSCLYEPWSQLYYPCSFLCSLDYLFIVWAISRTYNEAGLTGSTSFERKYQRILQLSYLGLMLFGSVGGIFLGIWMRDVMTRHLAQGSASNIYDIIPVVLYVISLILVIFTIGVIFIVFFGHRAAENHKLREERNVAERSNAAKSEFLANMSHEIRTPINAVIGMNEIILRESTEARDRLPAEPEAVRGIFSEISGYAGIISNAGKNLLAIINDILDLSRIEAGKLELRKEIYSLTAVLTDVCNLIRFRAEAKNLSFVVDVSGTLPDKLYGDEIRVRQVILNILNNAVKYTDTGSVTLTVTGSPRIRDPKSLDLTFAVRDTGIGIRPEEMNRLFDKFERTASADSSGEEGTGLGLAIVKNLLNLMDGSIKVDSVWGEGSVFTVTVPQGIVSDEPIGSFLDQLERTPESAQPSHEFFRAPDARILIVDDTRMNLTVAAGLLNSTGIRIDTAASGAEALERTLSVPYDMILMDQRMPEMDGTEAMRRIRAQEGGANQQAPVICLTADAIAGARDRYIAEGFTDYLTKPIDSRALRRALVMYLPQEKIIPVTEAESREAQVPAAEDRFAALRAAGIDAAQGLAFCQHSEELYRSVLREYAGGAAEKSDLLQRYYSAADWKNYAILVHAVKSTSATIGAAGLSEKALRLEQAANSGDTETLRREHAPLLDLYGETARTVLSVCGEDPLPPSESGDGVFEFMPDE